MLTPGVFASKDWTPSRPGTASLDYSATLIRSGQVMSMTNSGPDTIGLVSPTHQAVDLIDYSGAEVGQVVAHR